MYFCVVLNAKIMDSQNDKSVLSVDAGQSLTKTKVLALSYSTGCCAEKSVQNLDEISAMLEDANIVTWLRVFGMSDFNWIISLLRMVGLDERDADNILTSPRIVSVDEDERSLYAVVPVVFRNDGVLVSEQVALIVGTNYLITIQDHDHPLFDELYANIRDGKSKKITARKPDYLLASILDEIIGGYGDEATHLEDALEDLEDALLDINQIHNDMISQIQEKRRDLICLRKLLLPFKDQFGKLIRSDSGVISEQEMPYFKDINRQLLYILQNMESFREILSSLVDIYLNNNDLKLNVLMKQWTMVATIFLPLTFLVGVWGMNFSNMPELSMNYGYLWAWLLMIVIGVAVWLYLRRKDRRS